MRIAALRRSAPSDSPRPSVLVAAELPILVIEGALAALMSFTLVGPLGIPWWVPLVCLAVALAVIAGLTRFCRDRRDGFWKGLAVIDLLPIGPSLGAATAVLILGTNGVAVVAAAGALLTATAAVGALCFAVWALVDRFRPSAAPVPL